MELADQEIAAPTSSVSLVLRMDISKTFQTYRIFGEVTTPLRPCLRLLRYQAGKMYSSLKGFESRRNYGNHVCILTFNVNHGGLRAPPLTIVVGGDEALLCHCVTV